LAITARKPTLWRGEFENRPGALARVLGPLADASVDPAFGHAVFGLDGRADAGRAAAPMC